MVKQKKIPKLRFPEFEGVWEKKTVGELGVFTGGGTPDTAIAKYWQGNIPWISSSDIQEDTVQEYLTSRFITEEAIKKSATKIVPKNSVLIVSRVGIGKFAVSKSPVCTSQDFTSLTPLVDNPYFLAYYFKEKTNLFFRFSQGTSIKGFTGTDIRNMVFKVPSLSEQQKIASFFTAIDQKISQLKRKKTLLEQYKKGVIQKIFSQEIRFKDDNGQEFPKWEEKKLGNIGKTYNGLTGKSKDDFGHGKPYIQYKQVFDDSRIDITRFDFVRIRDGEKQCRVKYGDVFFTTSSETPDEVGTSSVLLDEVGEVYLNSFCFGYRSSPKVLIPMFSRYLFRNELLRKEINKLSQGSTRYNMSKNELMKTVIELPSIQEQTKIANFLSAIDVKINHTQKQIEKAEVWKKGLMQQMFV
ncbi:MAG TPA: restriction endonuclease subunit S [Bacteroidales bacterium]|nr:restriction endonuclease subunit S [Bacteroidales bacterium]